MEIINRFWSRYVQQIIGQPKRVAARYRLLSGVTAGIYVIAVLVLAIWGGSRLYQWSRQTVFPGKSYPSISALAAAAAQPNPGSGHDDITAHDPDQGLPSGNPVRAERFEIPLGLPPRISFLLLGTDERPDDPSPPRTDTMILVVLDLEHRSAGMITLPMLSVKIAPILAAVHSLRKIPSVVSLVNRWSTMHKSISTDSSI
jgi:hypothetical protein